MSRVTRIIVALTVIALAAVTAVYASTTSTQRATSTDRAAQMTAHRGGTMKLLAKAAGGTLDPQVNYTLQYWNLFQATHDGLLGFKKAGGDAAFEVVPDIAETLPTPTNGGKTWVFKIRKGIKFSNGKELTPADVVASFQRIFKVKSPTSGGFYAGIVGADACLKTPATCTLKGGISANDAARTVTINLTAPDPEFKFKLAVPHAAIVPANSPPKDAGTTPLPGTGAYYFASYNPTKQLVMKRNPYFKQWSAAAQPDGYPDEIVESFGLTVEAQITAIENGQADWTLEQPPADRLGEIGDEVREPGARQHADGVLVPADEHQPGAVQQREGPPGRELRDRPQRRSQALRRPEAGGPVLPGAASRLPGLQAVLPVHEEPRHQVVGA